MLRDSRPHSQPSPSRLPPPLKALNPALVGLALLVALTGTVPMPDCATSRFLQDFQMTCPSAAAYGSWLTFTVENKHEQQHDSSCMQVVATLRGSQPDGRVQQRDAARRGVHHLEEIVPAVQRWTDIRICNVHAAHAIETVCAPVQQHSSVVIAAALHSQVAAQDAQDVRHPVAADQQRKGHKDEGQVEALRVSNKE